ncbi:MAG TPA: DUF2783 domain-containing protein [Steroidobacteraceae bacterium]|nr:DUF2783 domain-containing protein [Steroidobacteraceae bacterium]
MPLTLRSNFHDPARPRFREYSAGDDFYELLIESHRGLDEARSAKLNAKLILLLANHIGDLSVLRTAVDLAREGV